MNCSIPSVHASDDLHLSTIALKILEYLSHIFKKKIHLVSFEITIGSGLGPVLTWLYSRDLFTYGFLNFVLECTGVDIVFHQMHMESAPSIIFGSTHYTLLLYLLHHGIYEINHEKYFSLSNIF